MGLALANTQLKIISPLKTIQNNKNTIQEIIKIIKNYSIQKVIIGLPLYPVSKQYNQLYKHIKSFSKQLEFECLKNLQRQIQIEFIEEEYTTEIAKMYCSKAKKDKLDMYAATIILKTYLGGAYGDINS
ncbi:MAG: RuvX/YqgF family protein [bacterium]